LTQCFENATLFAQDGEKTEVRSKTPVKNIINNDQYDILYTPLKGSCSVWF